MQRLSIVNKIRIVDVISSSIFQIGDSAYINSKTKALAVQKELPIFTGDEGQLNKFSIYTRKLQKQRITERLNLQNHYEVPIIKVGNINIIAVAASSVVHIGTTQFVQTDSRIKHFRRFFYTPQDYVPSGAPIL